MSNNASVGEIGLDLVLNSKEFTNMLPGIGKLAGKIGAMLAAAFSVKEIVEFSKECVELGSDLQEVQNVVDVTFSLMSKKVDEFAQSAAGSFGLSETMAKRFVGTFGSMADAFGFSEQQAYDMSTALTGLAGDIASFYNITQDEAYTKLKSVFTGETESLKDLGVVMTQTALDAYALANGFGKTTSAMTEAEKVALRYKFVQDQLSNASGDFERTSGSWANQVRIMNLQLDSIKAKLGQGLIAALTPVIKVVNVVLEKISSLAGAFQSMMEGFFGSDSSGAGGAIDAAAGLAESTGQTADNLEKASRFLAGFDKIQKVSGNNTSSTGDTSSFDFSVDGTSKAETAVDKTVSGIERKLEKLKNYLTIKFKPAAEKVFGVGKQVVDDFGVAFDTLWEDVIKPTGEFISEGWEDLGTVFQDFWDKWAEPIFDELEKAYKNTKEDAEDLWNNVLYPIFDKLMEVADELWDEHLGPLAEDFADLCGQFSEGALKIYNEFIHPLRQWIINELAPALEDDFGDAIEDAGDFIGDLIDAADELTLALSGVIDFLVGSFTGDWDLAWQGIKKTFEGTFGAIGKIIENPINGVVTGINQMLSSITEKINGFISDINSIKIGNWSPDIPLLEAPQLPLLGDEERGEIKESFGEKKQINQNVKASGTSTVPHVPTPSGKKSFVSIDMFAEGAYVKANTPQLAIIGDNKHQGEFVAPEGKLYDTVLQAAKAAGSGLSRAEMESIINNAVMRIVAALAGMGFYLDSEQLATALQSAEQAIDTRFNPVTPA